jgi:hypothetical protein
MVGIMVAVLIGLTIPVFAGNPHNQNSIVSVIGTATTEGIGSGQLRVTTINASTLPRGGATGTVTVIRWVGAEPMVLAVKDLLVEGDWAYLLLFDKNVGWWYLVVHDVSGGPDEVSFLWSSKTGNGTRTYFETRWKEGSDGVHDFMMPVIDSGDYVFTP